MQLEADDGPDTALARALLDGGVVPLETLRTCLNEVRARRGAGASLASVLLARGLASVGAIEHAVARLEGATTAAGASAPTAASSGPGQRLGPYRLVRELARGGMGAVHEAVHEPTGATRAVKTLTLVDPEGLLRFRTEVEALARLDHPHVVRVHEASLADRPLWLAQDLLPGGTLQQRLARGPMPIEEATRIAIALAAGLQHAHERGVLHRDVKPQNVLFDDQGAPRLTDFGLARCVDRASRLTATGTVLGTPTYMPPEQARGEELDARGDVYSLGVVLWALLAGRPPFQGGSALALLAQVLRSGVPSVRAARPDVPPALARVIERATARDREARPATAAELASELERALSAGTSPRSRLVPAALVLAALAAGAAAVLELSREGPLERPMQGEATPAPARSASPTAADAPGDVAGEWSPPSWLRRLDERLDVTTMKAALDALQRAGAAPIDLRARDEARAALARSALAWRAPAAGEQDEVARYEELLWRTLLRRRLGEAAPLPPGSTAAILAACLTLGPERKENVARIAPPLVRAAPDDLNALLLGVEHARVAPVHERDLDVLRAAVRVARDRGSPEELASGLELLSATLMSFDDDAALRAECVALGRDLDRVPRATACTVLLRASMRAAPDEALDLAARAERLGASAIDVNQRRSRALMVRYYERGDRADRSAAIASGELVLERIAALPRKQRRRGEVINVAGTLFRCYRPTLPADPPGALVAAFDRALALVDPDELAGPAMQRWLVLLEDGADEPTVEQARADTLRRLAARIDLVAARGWPGLAELRSLHALAQGPTTDRAKFTAQLWAALAVQATADALAKE